MASFTSRLMGEYRRGGQTKKEKREHSVGEGGPCLDVELFKGMGTQTAEMFLPLCGCR